MVDEIPIDPPDPRPLTPREEERVRRLLAQARHQEPMPPEVVARLDAVLVDLGTADADRTAAPPVEAGQPVVDLAARRRRRRATRLLVAAAAVTVLGVGGPQLLRGAGDLMTAGDSSAESAAGGADVRADNAPQRDGPSSGLLTGGSEPAEPRPETQAATDFVALRPQGLERQLAELDALETQYLAGIPRTREYPSGKSQRQCRGDAAWGQGRRIPVTYDGEPGVAVFRTPVGDLRRVDVILCGESTPARTVFIPAP
jgi:hypothetical protein